jgi:hypothetical protein
MRWCPYHGGLPCCRWNALVFGLTLKKGCHHAFGSYLLILFPTPYLSWRASYYPQFTLAQNKFQEAKEEGKNQCFLAELNR